MTVYIPLYEEEMEVLTHPTSIFDTIIAGQNDTKGDYYVILLTNKGTRYAITNENLTAYKSKFKHLAPGETATFYGEEVIGMTWEEECQWNVGYISDKVVDLWGNLKANVTEEKTKVWLG